MEIVTVLLALSAAIQFGLTVYIQNIGLRHTDAATGAFLSVGTMAAIFWILSPLFIEWHWWTTHAAVLFALCGLIFPALGQRLQIASLVHVGPALTSAVGSFTPLFAVLPAVLFLSETFNIELATGLVLLMAGLLILVLRPKSLQWDWPVWALALPLGAAFARGIVQPVAKAGLREVPSAFFSAMVMATVSTMVVSIFLLRSVRTSRGGYFTKGGLWFVLNGAVTGTGILAMQIAISRGEVTVVAPLVATTPLWTLILGLMFFRHEKLGLRHLLVAGLIFAGAVLIVTR